MVRRRMMGRPGRTARTERTGRVASAERVGLVAMCARGVGDGIGPEEMGWGGSRFVHGDVCAAPASASERQRSITITAASEGVLQSMRRNAMRCNAVHCTTGLLDHRKPQPDPTRPDPTRPDSLVLGPPPSGGGCRCGRTSPRDHASWAMSRWTIVSGCRRQQRAAGSGSCEAGFQAGTRPSRGTVAGMKEMGPKMASPTYSLGESSLASAESMISGGMILLVLQLSRICNVQRISKAQPSAVRCQVYCLFLFLAPFASLLLAWRARAPATGARLSPLASFSAHSSAARFPTYFLLLSALCPPPR
jgi:hypothetical protein